MKQTHTTLTISPGFPGKTLPSVAEARQLCDYCNVHIGYEVYAKFHVSLG